MNPLRPELAVACPACLAPAGERCKDYRGRRKPSCRARREALPPAPPCAAPAVMVERTLEQVARDARAQRAAEARAKDPTLAALDDDAVLEELDDRVLAELAARRAAVEAESERQARATIAARAKKGDKVAKKTLSKDPCPRCQRPWGYHAGRKCPSATVAERLAREDAALAVIPCPTCGKPAGERCDSGIGCSTRIRLVEQHLEREALAAKSEAAVRATAARLAIPAPVAFTKPTQLSLFA